MLLRVEDLDPSRVVANSEESLREDLAWLGLVTPHPPEDEPGPLRQSQRSPLYLAAIEQLAAAGATYLCDCSRREIALSASAPHEGEEGPPYPGTCRPHGMANRTFRRPPCVRLAVPSSGVVLVRDVITGSSEVPRAQVSDFVLRRADGVFSYQLAVVVDDLTMGVTEIVRGADLAPSAPRQALLAALLGGELPPVLHVPMLVFERGERLAKRSRSVTVDELRRRGWSARAVLELLARLYGATPPAAGDLVQALAEGFPPERWPTRAVSLDEGILSP